MKLRYTRRKRGKLFWEPTPEMKKKGFRPQALGDDGPEAQAKALQLYQAWLRTRKEDARPTKYPPGTFGAFYDRFRLTAKWAKKAVRTREDYERAWVRIDTWRPDPERETLARTVITKITTDDVEAFYDHLENTYSDRERWRVIKGLKILLADAMPRLRLGMPSPAAAVANPQPAGRSAFWLGAEIDRLAARAQLMAYPGTSLGIRIAFETLFSPVDVWTLQIEQLKRDAAGFFFHRERTKTDKEAYAAISDQLASDLLAYIGKREVGAIILQRNGQPYRSKDTFGDDFRAVRKAEFGKDETRQLMDIRRSGNLEADAAGADKATMGELLANSLADSKFLEETYTPPTVAKARDVAVKRLEGRKKLAAELTRLKARG